MKYKRYLVAYLEDYGLILGFVGLCIVFGIIMPDFFTMANFRHLIRYITITGVISLGLTVIVRAGSIDLSIGSVASCGHSFSAGLVGLLGVAPGVAATMGIALGFGLANAAIVIHLGVPGLVGTLAMMFIARAVALLYDGGFPILIKGHAPFLEMAHANVGPMPHFGVILFGLAGLLGFLLTYTRVGRYIKASGRNPIATFFSGVVVNRYLTFSFGVSSLFAGIGGILLTTRLAGSQPQGGEKYLLECIAAVFIGSTFGKQKVANIPGTIVGFLLLGLISTGFRFMGLVYTWIFFFHGIILIIALTLSYLFRQRELRRSYMF